MAERPTNLIFMKNTILSERVMAPDLVKNVDYYLTFDFYGFGGKKVKLWKRIPSKDAWPGLGIRGIAPVVKDAEGNIFIIHPKAYLFKNKPMATAATLPAPTANPVATPILLQLG